MMSRELEVSAAMPDFDEIRANMDWAIDFPKLVRVAREKVLDQMCLEDADYFFPKLPPITEDQQAKEA